MKQAVILIHGMGEQVPMDTLRGFVNAVWTTDTSVGRVPRQNSVWSKPDAMSGDFELRRLTTDKNREWRRTDFFEFYWAHMMQGTEVSHLLAWLKLLIFRAPGRIPEQLRGTWYFLVATAVGAAIGIAAFYVWGDAVPNWIKAVVTVVGPLLWATVGAFVVKKVVGDAARYLHVAPENIESRHRIREAGIKLLEKLHRSKDYDRIVVVGHSLGSVIGYDILNHSWARLHTSFDAAKFPQALTALETLEELARNPPDTRKATPAERTDYTAKYQAAQTAYFRELRAAGHPWLVTDFVTMGSPLAHAVLLLARTETEFDAKKKQREFPTCPPALETIRDAKQQKRQKFSFRFNRAWCPHQAAVFAPTRWTNLYFPCRDTIRGDVIGGPVAPAFGPGVRDMPVETTLQGGLFTHTLYWTFPPGATTGPAPSWIASLREAVRICLAPRPPPRDLAPGGPAAAGLAPDDDDESADESESEDETA